MNYTELFKDFLLFYLKCDNKPFKENATLTPFLKAIIKCSPEYGMILKTQFNVKLRNALSHGTYHIMKIDSEVRIYYYDSLKKLDKPSYIELSKFHIVMKNNNLLFQILLECFTEIMGKK